MFKNIKILLFILVVVFSLTTPFNLIFAQSTGGVGVCNLPAKAGFADMFAHVSCIIYNTLVPMFFAIALVLFIWGVIQYMINPSDEGKREKGKQYIWWGLVGLTVIISVWGLVAILGSTFGLDTSIVPGAPGTGSN